MNRHINSETIFSIIGNEPITDQYDILYSSLQAGSIHDNYVTGALLYYATNQGGNEAAKSDPLYDVPFLVKGERGLLFSKLTVPRNVFPNVAFNTGSLGYSLQPLYERAGTIRNIKLFSSEERFYDSLAPNVVDMFRSLGGDLFTIKVPLNALKAAYHNIVVFDNDPYTLFHETHGLSPIGFEQSFPFEPKFSQIKRIKRLSNQFISKKRFSVLGGVEDQNAFKTQKLAIVEYNSGSFLGSADPSLVPNPPDEPFDANWWLGDLVYRPNETVVDASTSPPKTYKPFSIFGDPPPETETTKILFGFGDRHSIKLKTGVLGGGFEALGPIQLRVGKRNLCESRTSVAVGATIGGITGPFGRYPEFQFVFRISPIIRGWKYGLIDGNPHYTSCVFRRDRYGQLRDMLEQRLNSSFINDPVNSPNEYLGDVERQALPSVINAQLPTPVGLFGNIQKKIPSFGISQPPIKVNFVKLSYIEATKELLYYTEKPENTQSSNLSSHATSSLPYFDDFSQGRNRNQVPTLAGSIVLSSLSDLFGNTTIGG